MKMHHEFAPRTISEARTLRAQYLARMIRIMWRKSAAKFRASPTRMPAHAVPRPVR